MITTKVCRALAKLSRDDSIWKPLGHHSWESTARSPFPSSKSINCNLSRLCDSNFAVVRANRCKEEGWKGAYMEWLRRSISVHRDGGAGGATTTKPLSSNGIKPNYDHLCKVWLLGDGFVSGMPLHLCRGVGKTSFVLSFVGDPSEPSIALDFRIRTFELNGEMVKVPALHTTLCFTQHLNY